MGSILSDSAGSIGHMYETSSQLTIFSKRSKHL